MSTPRWVRFSELRGTAEATVDALQPLLQDQECELLGVDRLGWDRDAEEFCVVGERVPVESEADALRLLLEWQGIALCYEAYAVSSTFYLYLWKCKDSLCTAIEISPQMLWFEREDFTEGQWLQQFLIAATGAMDTDLCGFGQQYQVSYVPLRTEDILNELNTLVLLNSPPPSFHMVSERVLNKEEVQAIIRTGEKSASLRYFVTTSGYHVFSDL